MTFTKGNHTKTEWKSGQSGNPMGRPRAGYSIVEVIQDFFSANPEKKQQMIVNMWRIAATGEGKEAVMAFHELTNRTDGQSPIKIPPEEEIDKLSNEELFSRVQELRKRMEQKKITAKTDSQSMAEGFSIAPQVNKVEEGEVV